MTHKPSNAVDFRKLAFTKLTNDNGKTKSTTSKSRTTAAGAIVDIKNDMKNSSIILILICIFIFVSSCEKNITKKYSGKYYFTTEAFSYIYNTGTVDSVIYFNGSITADSKNTLKIEYAPFIVSDSSSSLPYIYVDGIIFPTIDEDGKLTYPDYCCTHCYFSGNFHENGDVEIEFGNHGNGGGYSNKIYGTKVK